MLKKTKLSGV